MYSTTKMDLHIGDRHQLNPTVVSSGQPDVNPHSDQILMSLFGRDASLHAPAAKLYVQHRATVGLMWFSSENCYFGELQDGRGTELNHPSRELSLKLQHFHEENYRKHDHFMFLNIPGTNPTQDGTSFNNTVFALVVFDYIKRLYRYFTSMEEVRPAQICIITPYSAQIKRYDTLYRH